MAFLIAEAGVNHNGSVSTAKALIDAAQQAGADAVKFQVFDAEKLHPPGQMRDRLRLLQLSRRDFEALKSHADKAGIEFMATPFDVESLDFLVGLGVKRLKIGSGNLGDFRLLDAASETGLPVILSTGMASLGDIALALTRLSSVDMTLLHCTSAYPAPSADVNLRAMGSMREVFPWCKVGLSDHSLGIAVPIAATALGAEVIEKHITLDNAQPGPDHMCSLNPDVFERMIGGIRTVEAALGDGVKRPRDSEQPTIAVATERRAWQTR